MLQLDPCIRGTNNGVGQTAYQEPSMPEAEMNNQKICSINGILVTYRFIINECAKEWGACQVCDHFFFMWHAQYFLRLGFADCQKLYQPM